jgi:hypothetical protein
LHVLSTPPAFVLSQDQTLRKKCFHPASWTKFYESPGNRGIQFDLTKSDCLTICLIQILLTDLHKSISAKLLASTLCTLLSSQGSDASEALHFCWGFRATSLTYLFISSLSNSTRRKIFEEVQS